MEAHAFRVRSRSVEIDAQCYASQPATCQIARQMASCLQEGHIVFLPRGKLAPFTTAGLSGGWRGMSIAQVCISLALVA